MEAPKSGICALHLNDTNLVEIIEHNKILENFVTDPCLINISDIRSIAQILLINSTPS